MKVTIYSWSIKVEYVPIIKDEKGNPVNFETNSRTGTIKVTKEGLDKLLSNEKRFAHGVLSVGHELQHLKQHESGMGGAGKLHQREFEAHYQEATAKELPGTGVMKESTRIKYAKEALEHYDKMSSEVQEKYKAEKEALQKKFNL